MTIWDLETAGAKNPIGQERCKCKREFEAVNAKV